MNFLSMNKFCFTIVLIILFSENCYGQEVIGSQIKQKVVNNGIGLGSVIAVVISWSRNKSILFAILHGLFSWLYVLYFIITRNSEEK